ncbi:MAG: hypothetical protein DI537_10525 [Stutzerimonas stutzeri]|nr:MAG: hypothetical protein DI537_10525 [Stutzerimonas stutzeri]
MDHLENYHVTIALDAFDEATPVAGSGIDGLTVADVTPIGDCALSPGDPSPVGRCPETGSLVYLDRDTDRIRSHAQEMFDLLVDMLSPGATSASVISTGRELLAVLGKDVMAVENLLNRHHWVGFRTDFLQTLANSDEGESEDGGLPLMVQKAKALLAPVYDYHGAAQSAGWSIGPDDTDDALFGYSGHGRFARGFKTADEAARCCCELNNIEPAETPHEHWLVDERLAASLVAHGERVDLTFPGGPIWARPATRGNLKKDPILYLIAKGMH